jgi:hypothetical protein
MPSARLSSLVSNLRLMETRNTYCSLQRVMHRTRWRLASSLRHAGMRAQRAAWASKPAPAGAAPHGRGMPPPAPRPGHGIFRPTLPPHEQELARTAAGLRLHSTARGPAGSGPCDDAGPGVTARSARNSGPNLRPESPARISGPNLRPESTVRRRRCARARAARLGRGETKALGKWSRREDPLVAEGGGPMDPEPGIFTKRLGRGEWAGGGPRAPRAPRRDERAAPAPRQPVGSSPVSRHRPAARGPRRTGPGGPARPGDADSAAARASTRPSRAGPGRPGPSESPLLRVTAAAAAAPRVLPRCSQRPSQSESLRLGVTV